jgi:hypothetical protein
MYSTSTYEEHRTINTMYQPKVKILHKTKPKKKRLKLTKSMIKKKLRGYVFTSLFLGGWLICSRGIKLNRLII